MINNRQAGRRNRGRNNNNGRPNGNNRGGGDNGNRIDNRSRGNAAQLLEKYKNMARDAQMAGDRVNAEYYLQFADHYFRVLADNRARQEEQQQRFRPRDDNGFDEESDDFDGMDQGSDDFRADQSSDRSYGERAPREQYREQGRDQDRQDRRSEESRDGEGRNNNRRDRNRRDRYQGGDAAPAQPEQQPAFQPAAEPVAVATPAAQPVSETEEAKPRRGRPRKAKPVSEEGEAFDIAVLPPSIARADNDAEAEAEAPKKRGRRPRATATEAAE